MIETLPAVEPVISPLAAVLYRPPEGGIRLPRCYGFRLVNPKTTYYVVQTNAAGAPVKRRPVRDSTWYGEVTGPWWIEAVGPLGSDPTPIAVDVEVATAASDKPPAPVLGYSGAPLPVDVTNVGAINLIVPPVVGVDVLTKAYGAPVNGAAAVIALNGADQNVATVAGRLLQLTAVDGDAFYAVDGDSTVAGNKNLLLAGASILIRAGAALHATQGPAAGGSLYVSQFA